MEDPDEAWVDFRHFEDIEIYKVCFLKVTPQEPTEILYAWTIN